MQVRSICAVEDCSVRGGVLSQGNPREALRLARNWELEADEAWAGSGIMVANPHTQ